MRNTTEGHILWWKCGFFFSLLLRRSLKSQPELSIVWNPLCHSCYAPIQHCTCSPPPPKLNYRRHLTIGMFGEVNLSPLEHSTSKTPCHVARLLAANTVVVLFCFFLQTEIAFNFLFFPPSVFFQISLDASQVTSWHLLSNSLTKLVFADKK